MTNRAYNGWGALGYLLSLKVGAIQGGSLPSLTLHTLEASMRRQRDQM
jgi:hypothetical protein